MPIGEAMMGASKPPVAVDPALLLAVASEMVVEASHHVAKAHRLLMFPDGTSHEVVRGRSTIAREELRFACDQLSELVDLLLAAGPAGDQQRGSEDG